MGQRLALKTKDLQPLLNELRFKPLDFKNYLRMDEILIVNYYQWLRL